jgi:hypothetical protein
MVPVLPVLPVILLGATSGSETTARQTDASTLAVYSRRKDSKEAIMVGNAILLSKKVRMAFGIDPFEWANARTPVLATTIGTFAHEWRQHSRILVATVL